MAKLSNRYFLVVMMIVACILTHQIALAKVAQLSLKEMKDEAEIVAVVEISATRLTNEVAALHDNGMQKKLIHHQASTLDVIKGATANQEVAFLNVDGLIAGGKYVVFLSRGKDGQLRVAFTGHGAFRISHIAMKTVKLGLVEAAKVPGTILLPKILAAEVGDVDKNLPMSYGWVQFLDLMSYLKKI